VVHLHLLLDLLDQLEAIDVADSSLLAASLLIIFLAVYQLGFVLELVH